MHIGSQTISPWESWFQVAQVESEFDAAAGKYKVPVRLRIEAEFWKQYQWLNQLDKALQWTAHIYDVVLRHTMLGTFVANIIDAQCVDGDPQRARDSQPCVGVKGGPQACADRSS